MKKKVKILIKILSLYKILVEHPSMPPCLMHHRLVHYSSDTLPLTVSSNKNKNDNRDSSQMNGESFSHLHYHHATCQRAYKTQDIITPLVQKG